MRAKLISAAFAVLISSPALAWEAEVKNLGFGDKQAMATAIGSNGVIMIGCERSDQPAFIRLPSIERVPEGFTAKSALIEVSIDGEAPTSYAGQIGVSRGKTFLSTAELDPTVAGELYEAIARARKSIAARVKMKGDVVSSTIVSTSGSRSAVNTVSSVCKVERAKPDGKPDDKSGKKADANDDRPDPVATAKSDTEEDRVYNSCYFRSRITWAASACADATARELVQTFNSGADFAARLNAEKCKAGDRDSLTLMEDMVAKQGAAKACAHAKGNVAMLKRRIK